MRCPAHNPSEARKVGNPLSALMPAPVSTNNRSSAAIGIVVMSKSLTPVLSAARSTSFRSQRLHGINCSSAACGDKTSQCGCRKEHEDSSAQTNRIIWFHHIELVGHVVCGN